jgi:hypothetical protein
LGSKWKCQKCLSLKDVTITQFEIFFAGGNGEYSEKWKVTCKCGWKNSCDSTTKE